VFVAASLLFVHPERQSVPSPLRRDRRLRPTVPAGPPRPFAADEPFNGLT
jgi:hypothetical protein